MLDTGSARDGSGELGCLVPMRTRLEDAAKKWSKHLADAARGPLVIAPEVVSLGAEWTEHVAKELGHATYTGWLKTTLGEHEDFFRRRAHAVAVIGEHARRTYHHDAAVYVAGIEDEERRAELDQACLAAWSTRRAGVGYATSRAQDYPPLSRQQVIYIRRKLWNEQPDTKAKPTCKACDAMRAEVERLRAMLEKRGK